MSDPAMTRTPIAEALRQALDASGMSQAELGAAVARIEGRAEPYAQNAVSGWIAGRGELPPGRVFAIEQALRLRPGALSVHAGYLPAGTEVSLELALAADRDLTPAQREDVMAVIEVMRERTRGQR